MRATWWSAALTEEASGPLVLWRDAGGVARALEDRCPHRRAPVAGPKNWNASGLSAKKAAARATHRKQLTPERVDQSAAA